MMGAKQALNVIQIKEAYALDNAMNLSSLKSATCNMELTPLQKLQNN
jgi:hypothetical protein